MFKLYAYFAQKEYRNYVDYTHECPLKKTKNASMLEQKHSNFVR
jgi:hypothetical protein